MSWAHIRKRSGNKTPTRARLKRISPKATSVAASQYAEEIRNAPNRHIVFVTLPGNQTVFTNECTWQAFHDYFQDMFTREPGLIHTQFAADVPYLEAAGAVGCECPVIGSEILKTLKILVLDKTSRWSHLQTVLEAFARSCSLARTDLQQMNKVGSYTSTLH